MKLSKPRQLRNKDWSQLTSLPALLFLRRAYVLEMGVLAAIGLLGCYLLYNAFFVTPIVPPVSTPVSELKVTTIDALELWLEEQAQEHERPLNFDNQRYFYRQSANQPKVP